MKNAHSNCEHERLSKQIELRVLLTNGDPICDTKLKFEFDPDPAGVARVWLVKLRPLKNPDAFPRQLKTGCWELQLNVIGDTYPLAVLNYTHESVSQWLAAIFNDQEPATTELLILAHNEEFTISIHQPKK